MLSQSHGIPTFLAKHCPDPAALAAVLERELRVDTLREDQLLCSAQDEAECVWIVEAALLQVMAGNSIAR